MGYVEQGKWTCPTCHRTVVIDATPADVKCCIEAAQRRHSEGHAAGAHVLDDLGLAGASARATSKARRAQSRAAARRRANQNRRSA